MSLAAVNVASCHVAPHTRPSHLLDAGCRGRMMGLFHPFQPKEGHGSRTASACQSARFTLFSRSSTWRPGMCQAQRRGLLVGHRS